MANAIRIKRRPSSGSPGAPSPASSLYNGELAFNENDNTLYYGYGSGVNGVAQSVPAIAGSGSYSLRGGTNATGTWPISINGNAAYATNAVYTTGNQTVSGVKTFTDTVKINGVNTANVATLILKGSTGSVIGFDGDIPEIYMDRTGINLSIINNNSNAYIEVAASAIKLDGTTQVKAANTAGNSVGYFAVFDSDPSSSLTTLKSVAKNQILDDIGAATSGLTLTAGSGLIGGGALSGNLIFHVGQGDGINIIENSVGVDSTVVRTTGNQDINGAKSFYDSSNTNLIFSTADDIIRLKAPNTGVTTYYFLGLDGGGSPPSSTSADRSVVSRSAEQLKSDIGLSNVTNDAQVKKIASSTSGYVPFWNGTGGDLLANGYSVETVLAGSSSSLPRADAVKTYVDNAIISGISTNDAMVFKGAIDCSANPNYPAADRGWTYKVSVAGKIGGASGPAVEVNDTLICTTDGTSSGNHATVGSNWVILQTNIADASILVTGPSSATSGNIAIFDGTTGKIIKDGGFLASNIVLTTGDQSIGGIKTFTGSYTKINNKIEIGNPNGAGTDYIVIDPGSVGGGSFLTLDINSGLSSNRTISFPDKNGTIALFSDITTTNISGVLSVDKGGTGQSSYTNGQLLIGNTTGNTLTKATLTAGTSVDITNGNGSITIGHADTSTLTGAQGTNGIASITVDGLGHVTAVTAATYLTGATVCAAIVDCTIDGGTF